MDKTTVYCGFNVIQQTESVMKNAVKLECPEGLFPQRLYRVVSCTVKVEGFVSTMYLWNAAQLLVKRG